MNELETRIANVVAQGLRDGLIHPGDPAQNQPPIAIPLAAFRGSPTLPPDQAEHMQATTQLVAEAIVALISTQVELVDPAELTELRDGDHPPAPDGTTMVYCRQCHLPLVGLPIREGVSTVDPRVLANNVTAHRCAGGFG